MAIINPNDEDNITGAFKFIVEKIKQDMQDMLPCRVVSVNRNLNRVTVKPLIGLITGDGTVISRANNVNLPIFNLSGGGFIINFPIAINDLGWIKANDRDISLFLQSFNEAEPNTLRKHSFEDGIFFPDSMTGYNIDGEDSSNLVIQNFDASVKISLGSSNITIKAPSTIKLQAENVEIESTNLTHNGTNIGDTHVHPQPNDSGGNIEQNTNGPQ